MAVGGVNRRNPSHQAPVGDHRVVFLNSGQGALIDGKAVEQIRRVSADHRGQRELVILFLLLQLQVFDILLVFPFDIVIIHGQGDHLVKLLLQLGVFRLQLLDGLSTGPHCSRRARGLAGDLLDRRGDKAHQG